MRPSDHFPDAYYGQSGCKAVEPTMELVLQAVPLTHRCPFASTDTKIRETLNNLILRSPQTWQTSVGLPFVKIEGTVSLAR